MMLYTLAEPLTEGVKAFVCGASPAATDLRGSRNRLTPSASLGSITFGSSWVAEPSDPLRLAALDHVRLFVGRGTV